MKPLRLKTTLVYASIAFAVLPNLAFAAPCASGAAIYTTADAAKGVADYNTNCASCHNADLSGNSGPALAGPKFQAYLQFTKITAGQLNDFISEQMPANAPGSLTKDQYAGIFAYLLSYNHYPSGPTGIAASDLSCLNMLPYPGSK